VEQSETATFSGKRGGFFSGSDRRRKNHVQVQVQCKNLVQVQVQVLVIGRRATP